jgi:hypothetical protein
MQQALSEVTAAFCLPTATRAAVRRQIPEFGNFKPESVSCQIGIMKIA